MQFATAILLHQAHMALREEPRHRELVDRVEAALVRAGYDPMDAEFWTRQEAKLQAIQNAAARL